MGRWAEVEVVVITTMVGPGTALAGRAAAVCAGRAVVGAGRVVMHAGKVGFGLEGRCVCWKGGVCAGRAVGAGRVVVGAGKAGFGTSFGSGAHLPLGAGRVVDNHVGVHSA